jgi:hypothetical protein
MSMIQAFLLEGGTHDGEQIDPGPAVAVRRFRTGTGRHR